MNIHEFLSYFDNVKGRDGQWTATCPCHDDKVNSLCIGYDYKSGKILVDCQAGCSTNDVVGAVGLKMSDLFDKEKSDSKPKKTDKKLSYTDDADEIYEYRNGNRKIKIQPKRQGEKKISWWDHIEKDGQFYKGRNTEKNCLFVAGNIDDDIVISIEGEKDAVRVNKTTPYTAVSPENGADEKGDKWLKWYTEELKGKTVYVVPDNDDVGRNFAKAECKKLYGKAEKVFLLDLKDVWPEIPEHNDFSDMCDILGDKEGVERLNKLIETATAYQPDNSDIDNGSADKETAAGLPLELDYGRYSVTDSGITYKAADKDGKPREVNVCSHVIIPTAIKRNIETGEEKFELWYRVGHCERTLTMDGNTIFSSQKIIGLSCFGVSVSSINAKQLVGYLQEIIDLNRETLPIIKCVSHCGGTADGEFVPYSDNIVYDGDPAFQPIMEALQPKGDLDTWIKGMEKPRQESVELRLMMGAAFGSVLIKPLNALPFVVHIWGRRSGAGKTVVEMLSASIYGNPTVGENYVSSFDGTRAYNERRAAFLNAIPVCIDEAQTIRRNANGTPQFSIYDLTEGSPRGRSNVGRGLDRMLSWRCSFLTTGETPLNDDTSYAGAENRVIDVPVPVDHDIFTKDTCRDVCDMVVDNYGLAGRKFVEEIRKPEIMECIRDSFHEATRILMDNYGITSKQAASGAIIKVADVLAVKTFWPGAEALPFDDIARYLKSEEQLDTGERDFQNLINTISLESHRFVWENNVNAYDEGYRKTETYGIIRKPQADGKQYVDIIETAFATICGKCNCNAQAMLSWLKFKGKIVTRADKGKNCVTYRTSINHQPTTVIRLIVESEEADEFLGGKQDEHKVLPFTSETS